MIKFIARFKELKVLENFGKGLEFVTKGIKGVETKGRVATIVNNLFAISLTNAQLAL